MRRACTPFPRSLIALKSLLIHANRAAGQHYENKSEYSVPILISQRPQSLTDSPRPGSSDRDNKAH